MNLEGDGDAAYAHSMDSDAPELRPLGATGLTVSPLTLGGGPLGSMPELFDRDVPERQAIDVVLAVLDSGIRTIDTSNGYSGGRSEERIGKAIAEYGRLPDDVLVITKVDAKGSDYSGERVRRSLAESRERLGIAPLPMVHLHDPEFHDFDTLSAPGGAVDALVAARDEGVVGHIGLAGGNVHEIARYFDLGVFEVLLVHNRWTLVDRSAGPLLERAEAAGLGLINAAVLGGGILADETGTAAKYAYRPAHPDTLAAIRAMREVCARWETAIGDAAIAFSTRDPRFATTVVGMSSAESVGKTLGAAALDRPQEFWDELEALLPPAELWIDAR